MLERQVGYNEFGAMSDFELHLTRYRHT